MWVSSISVRRFRGRSPRLFLVGFAEAPSPYLLVAHVLHLLKDRRQRLVYQTHCESARDRAGESSGDLSSAMSLAIGHLSYLLLLVRRQY